MRAAPPDLDTPPGGTLKTLATLATTFVVAVLVGIPSPAAAHAALETSNPADGAKLDEMPSTVSITLNEKVRTPAFLVLADEGGARVNSERVRIDTDGRTAISDVATNGAGPGDYSLSYRVVSEDNHAVTGTIRFTVEQSATSTTPSVPSPTSSAPAPADTAAPPIETDDPGGWSAMLTVLAFFVVAMAGLILFVRAGLRSSDHDEDTP